MHQDHRWTQSTITPLIIETTIQVLNNMDTEPQSQDQTVSKQEHTPVPQSESSRWYPASFIEDDCDLDLLSR